MKNILYLLVLLTLSSCNNKETEKTQTIIATPNGIQGLQKATVRMPAQPTNLIFNPPHGQAGHNCAIAVGAPLKTAVAKNQTNNENIQKISSTNLPKPVLVKSQEQKLNPKHGEPGHRCDIAVGAPLNSKPSKVVTTNSPQPKTKTIIADGKNLNPAHGEPNHRCDIAVGAPLT